MNYSLSTINPQTLNKVENKILNDLKSYINQEEPSFHISSFEDDFNDNTVNESIGTEFETDDHYAIHKFGYTQSDITNFLNKFNIDTDWKTKQLITI